MDKRKRVRVKSHLQNMILKKSRSQDTLYRFIEVCPGEILCVELGLQVANLALVQNH